VLINILDETFVLTPAEWKTGICYIQRTLGVGWEKDGRSGNHLVQRERKGLL